MFGILRSLKTPRALKSFVLGYVVVHLLAATVLIFLLTRTVRSLMIHEANHQMHAMATMLNEHIGDLEQGVLDPSLPKYLNQLGQKTQFRLTIVKGGYVLADSEIGADDLDGLEINSVEFLQEGFAELHSATKQISLGGRDDLGGEIRVAAPASLIDSSIHSLQKNLWIFAIILGLVTGLLMTILAAHILRPLTIFSESARRVGVGQFDQFPALLDRNDEWRSLADAFRKMQTESTNREQRIVKNRDRLQAVLSSMIEGVVALDPQHKVMIANHAARRMLGVGDSEIVGRNLLEVVRNPSLSSAVEKTQSKKTFSKTDFQTMNDTTRRTISARVSVLPNEANVDEETPGVVIVLHDITELRHLETLRQDFVANVSHELKTPLSSIKAYAETLRLGALNDKSRNIQFVEQIEAQANFLNQQIQDLLQLARVESGKQVWDISPVDLNQACEQSVARFAELAQNANVSLDLQLSDETPRARADADGLRTILNNLIANALNYTPEGGRVCVSTSYHANSAVIEVSDNGIGIAPEHHARIFERFYRVDKARSRDKGGTGLGLSIVKHLAQSFGGGVELTSAIGQGTTFRIRLPKYVA